MKRLFPLLIVATVVVPVLSACSGTDACPCRWHCAGGHGLQRHA